MTNIKLQKTLTKTKKLTPLLFSLVRLVLLIGLSYTILFPVLTKLSLVFMEQADLLDYSVKWIPKHYTLENIKVAAQLLDYGKSLLKSISFCALISILQVSVCTLAAYGFARFKGKIRAILFLLVIATLLIPPQTYIVTLYTQFQHFDILGLVNLINGKGINIIDTAWTFITLAATGMGIRCGLYIYVEKQTFAALPYELEEAAEVDGAGMFRTFFSVLLPNAIPTVIVCFILSFVWQWNDTFYTPYFASGLNLLSQQALSLNFTVSQYLGNWAARSSQYALLINATGMMLCVLPLIILFICCQRFFVQGVERSGLVG